MKEVIFKDTNEFGSQCTDSGPPAKSTDPGGCVASSHLPPEECGEAPPAHLVWGDGEEEENVSIFLGDTFLLTWTELCPLWALCTQGNT